MAEIEGLGPRRPAQATRIHTPPSERTALAENPVTYGQPGGLDTWAAPRWEEHRVNRTKGKFAGQRQLPPARDRNAHKWRGTGIEPALDNDWASPQWSDNRTQLETDQMVTAPSAGPPPSLRKRALDVARRIVTADAAFAEAQVKRDQAGRFSATGGGGAKRRPETLTVGLKSNPYYSRGGPRIVDVQVSPNANDIRRIAKKDREGAARVIRDLDGTVYAFPSDEALHAEIAKEVGVTGNFDVGVLHVDRNGRLKYEEDEWPEYDTLADWGLDAAMAADATMISPAGQSALAAFGNLWESLDGEHRRIYFPGRFREIYFDVLEGTFHPREESDLSQSKAESLGRELKKLVAADAEFQESDVKRDDDGKFATQAGGGKAPEFGEAQPPDVDALTALRERAKSDREARRESGLKMHQTSRAKKGDHAAKEAQAEASGEAWEKLSEAERKQWFAERPGKFRILARRNKPPYDEPYVLGERSDGSFILRREEEHYGGARDPYFTYHWRTVDTYATRAAAEREFHERTDPETLLRKREAAEAVRLADEERRTARIKAERAKEAAAREQRKRPLSPELEQLEKVAAQLDKRGREAAESIIDRYRYENKNLTDKQKAFVQSLTEQAAQPKTSPEDAKAHGEKLAKVGSEWQSPDGQKHRVYFKGKFRDVFYDITEGRFNSRYGSGISREETEALGKELLKKAGVAQDWASPRWGADQAFSEADVKRNDKGQFTAGSGAAKPPFEKGHRLARKAGRRKREQTRSTEGPISSWGRWITGAGKREKPGEGRSMQVRINDIPHTIHSHGGAMHWDQAKDMALDLALATARRIVAQDQATPPRMAFDRALFRGALPSQVMRVRLAMDQIGHSVRTFSPDGHMHVALSNISRAQCSPYWGKEIPEADTLGLDPARKYILLRHPDELRKAAPSFNGIPILAEHQPISADDHPHELVIGATGTDARWEPPFLQNSLHFWAKPAIDAIRTGKQRELSCAYHYVPDMTPGVYEGQRYDGIMRNIHGNHLALVEDGRVGPAAVVADSLPFDERLKMWLKG